MDKLIKVAVTEAVDHLDPAVRLGKPGREGRL
jgi:hypothetical protein